MIWMGTLPGVRLMPNRGWATTSGPWRLIENTITQWRSMIYGDYRAIIIPLACRQPRISGQKLDRGALAWVP